MKIICPFFYLNLNDALEELKAMNESACDLIEIRLDRAKAYKIEDLIQLVAHAKKKFILTLRSKQDGGEADMDHAVYEKKIIELFQIPDVIVDLELLHLQHFQDTRFKQYLDRCIISYHNFNKTPDNLNEIWKQMDIYQPYIEKVACMPQSKEDVLTLLLSCYEHKTISKKCAISMSDMGMISRIIGEMFDSEYTFCSLTTSSAPGQLPLEKMVEYLNILD